MLEIIRIYFEVDKDKIKITIPQTYKVRLTFECTEEEVQRCRERFRTQTIFLLLEVNELKRMMR
jgi:hypothetical protein